MADWLIIRWPREAGGEPSWLVADASGQVVMPPQRGALLQAAPLAGSRRVCVLVPTADVLLMSADLPAKTGSARLAQMVPFALEEQLAEDIDELHFALGKRSEGARTPVAIVAKSLMAQWMAELAQAGIAPEAIYGEGSLLPVTPGQITALLEPDATTLAGEDLPAISLPADELAAAFDLTAGTPAPAAPIDDAVELPVNVRAPASLVVYAAPEIWSAREAEIDALRGRFAAVRAQLLPAGPLALFAQQLVVAAPINLLQGPYAPQHSMARGLLAWRVAAILLACLIGLHVTGKVVELTQLKHTERDLDRAIDTLYRSTMAGAQAPADARHQMEARLLAARGNQATYGLLPALAALAQARTAAASLDIQTLSFSPSALELKVEAPDAASLDHINQQLRGAGWSADLTSGNAHGKSYEGRIQLKPPGAS